MSRILSKNALSLNAGKSFLKFLDLDPDVDIFQQCISSSLCKDTYVVKHNILSGGKNCFILQQHSVNVHFKANQANQLQREGLHICHKGMEVTFLHTHSAQ